MKTLRFALAPLAATAVAFAITKAPERSAVASSHAEAPAIADDPSMDNTDVWAWKDSGTTGNNGTITILTAWNGLSTPGGGPNYKKWTPYPQGLYEITIADVNGNDAITYQFRFQNVDNGTSTFLRATSPGSYGRLTSAGDTTQKFRQTYSVTKITGPRRNPTTSVVANNAGNNYPVSPPNTGPQLTWGRLGGTSTPQTLIGAGSTTTPGNVVAPATNNDYETKLGTGSNIQTLPNTGGFSSEQVFVGPRADAFFVDLGPTFDRLKLRTFLNAPGIAGAGTKSIDVGQYGGAFNTLSGKNVEVIALQIPVTELATFNFGIGAGYVGVWASSSRSKVRVLPINNATNNTGTGVDNREVAAGSFVQVSRLGNPLVNELFIPYDKKDAWNGDVPANDAAHWGQYYSAPEVPGIINAVYGVPVPPNPRNDLAFVFAPDTLKVNALGASINGTTTGAFATSTVLQGRTLADDVVDIYLKVAAGALVIPPALNGGTASGGYGLAGVFNMPAFLPPAAPAPNGSFTGATLGTPLNMLLGDGCDFGTAGAGCGLTLSSTFPYMGTPYDGQETGNDYFQSPRHN